MPVDPNYKLPWAPTAGDLAPKWKAFTAGGEKLGSDHVAGKPALICLIPGQDPGAATAFFNGLGARLSTLEAAGCAVQALVTDPGPIAAASWEFPILVDEDRTISHRFSQPRARRHTNGGRNPRAN